MKNVILTLTVLFAVSSAQAARSISERINTAVALLGEVSEGSYTVKIAANKDPKVMMLEYALAEGAVDDAADFENHYVTDGSAWEADSTLWGSETLAGGQDYIQGSVQQFLEDGPQEDADKIKYANSMLKLNRAFEILKSIRSVRFGVAPTGAVQCGVTFPALLIIDTEGGAIHQIVMEGSGC